MKLLVDIGNTRAKWRCVSDHDHAVNGVLNNSDITEATLRHIFQQNTIDSVIVSSVGRPDVTAKFLAVAQDQGISSKCLTAAKAMAGLTFAYENIAALGVDRCLAMIGAFQQQGVLVIDAGSAITADFLGADGQHYGGFIIPGCGMLRLSLKAGTSQISVDADLGSTMPGTSTESCVSNGFTLLLQSLIAGWLNKAAELNINQVQITGGDAELIARACPDTSFQLKNNLVLDGMAKLLK